jgi:hypothetical protein
LATFDEERRDPRFPRCPTHAWFEVALPTDPASLWADVWGRRLLAVAALTGVLTALILLAFRGLAAQPGLWLAMLCIPAAAACQWFSYDAPFSSSFRFGYAAEYAENILKYAKRPLDLPQYLADLDPWTSQPADGTLSAWRLEVDRRGLPGMSDAEIVHNLLAACEQPGSPYRQWWTDFVLPHRQKAESRDGEVRTCSICRGRGGKISIDKCYSCNGTGVHAKPYRRLINFVTVPIARDVSVVHRTYETGCEYTQCKTCNGTGKTSSTYQCDDCSSTGTVKYSAQDVYAVDSRALVAAEARREFGGGTGEVVQAGGEEAVAGLPSFALVCAMVATFVMLATCSAPEPNADASPSQPTVQGRQ